MYLIDTNVISEIRKGKKANSGVRSFFDELEINKSVAYISVITIGELRRGIDLIYHRGDQKQGEMLERWLEKIRQEYSHNILAVDPEVALLWGKMRVPNPQHALDKLIAATALINGLTVVTRNTKDFQHTGVQLLNPFI